VRWGGVGGLREVFVGVRGYNGARRPAHTTLPARIAFRESKMHRIKQECGVKSRGGKDA